MSIPNITVLNMYQVKQGPLLAFFSVQIGPFTIHKCRLVREDGKVAWASGPQEAWTDGVTGKRRYFTLVDMPREWRDVITAASWSAWQQVEQNEGQG